MAKKKNKIDVFESSLVPPHKRLSEEEKQMLLKKFKIVEEQLPKMFSSDPVAKAMDAKEGDVLKIERDSETAGKTYYYRLVIDE